MTQLYAKKGTASSTFLKDCTFFLETDFFSGFAATSPLLLGLFHHSDPAGARAAFPDLQIKKHRLQTQQIHSCLVFRSRLRESLLVIIYCEQAHPSFHCRIVHRPSPSVESEFPFEPSPYAASPAVGARGEMYRKSAFATS